MDIDKILDDLMKSIDELEEEKQRLTDLQEQTRQMIARANAFFESFEGGKEHG